MDEVERLADRVAVIAHGEMVALGSPANLGEGPKYVCVAFRLPPGVAPSDLPPLDGGARFEGGKVVVDTLTPTLCTTG
jgi:ABC-2 type transport system ATP-binding protein